MAYPRQLSRQGSVVGKPVQILKRARGVSPASQRHDSHVHAMSVVNVTTITGGDCIGRQTPLQLFHSLLLIHNHLRLRPSLGRHVRSLFLIYSAC